MPHTSEKLNLTPDYCRHEVRKANMKGKKREEPL